MIYEGIIGYSYNEIVSEVNCYVDQARKIITIDADEACGVCDDDKVIVFYDVSDLMPMVISERVDKTQIQKDLVMKRLDIFNKNQTNFVATMEETDSYYEITVARSQIFKVVQETM